MFNFRLVSRGQWHHFATNYDQFFVFESGIVDEERDFTLASGSGFQFLFAYDRWYTDNLLFSLLTAW